MLLDQVQTRFAAYYASHNLLQPNGSLGSLVVLTGGWASSLYTFTIQPGEPDAAAVTRVLKTYAPNAYGREHALREWQALTRLRAVAFPVPHAMLCEPDDHPLGNPFIVMEYISGQPLWQIYETADQATQDQLTRLFVAHLIALHSLDPHLLAPTTASTHPYAFIDQELEHLRRDSQRSPHTTLIEIVLWLEQHKQTVPCERPVILHRDYHPWNVLVDATEHLWLIDWDWQIGDARFDLAWACMLMRRSGFHAFSDAVQADYVRQRGSSLDGLAYFEVLTTMRWLLNVTYSIESEEMLRGAARAEFQAFLVEPVRYAATFLQERTGIWVEIQMPSR